MHQASDWLRRSIISEITCSVWNAMLNSLQYNLYYQLTSVKLVSVLGLFASAKNVM